MTRSFSTGLAALALLALMGQAAPSAHAQAPTAAPVAATALKVGDKAPPLKIGHWVKGDKFDGFESGKAYVIEFWATWCAPCIQNIPHLTKLQKTYKDKGLIVVGVSSADAKGVDDVRPFVSRMGDRMDYTVAVDNEYQTAAAYMAATNQQGIPCAYVVDKAGRLAWFGHPANNMDEVVKRVVAGTFDHASWNKDLEIQQQRQARFQEAVSKQDWTAAESILDEIRQADPSQANGISQIRFILYYQFRNDKKAAVAFANGLLEKDLKDDAGALLNLLQYITNDAIAPEEAQALGIRLAHRAVELEPKDANVLAALANAYRTAGKLPEAVAAQERAVAAAPDESARRMLEGRLQVLRVEAQSRPATPAP